MAKATTTPHSELELVLAWRPTFWHRSAVRTAAELAYDDAAEHLWAASTRSRLERISLRIRGRSTVDPLLCVRRLVDIAEQGHDKLVLIFCAWEKAFGNIKHTRMFQALTRLTIPEQVLRNVKDPEFQVLVKDQASDPQRTGIRQGCLLSPY